MGYMLTCYFEDGHKALLRHVVVHGVVIKDGKILLTKRAGNLLETGKWCLPGGYMDRDETLVQGIEREVLEETGWKVKNVEFMSFIDNPDRPNDGERQNIGINFICQAAEQVGESDHEVSEQKWYDLDKLPPADQIAFDHGLVIDEYRKRHQMSGV